MRSAIFSSKIRNMRQVLCSTGAIIGKPNNRDYRLLEDFSARILCDGFELLLYRSFYDEIDALKDWFSGRSLNIPVVHSEKSIGELISAGGADIERANRLFEINCDVARSVGAGKIVLHLWSGQISDSNFQSNLGAYKKVREIAENYGLDLLIENVVCNISSPMRHLCELRQEYPDVHFVFDTKMAAFHEELDQLYAAEHSWLWKDGHIRHYHVNDYAGGFKDWANLRTLAVGKGRIDFDRFFDFLAGTGYDGDFTIESTAFGSDGSVDFNMLNGQITYIKNKIVEIESAGKSGD